MGRAVWLLQLIREHLGILEAKVGEAGEGLAGDSLALYVAHHLLQAASQALMDPAAHAAAEAGPGVPERYAALPELLAGALSSEGAAALRRTIGLRNVVVRCYARVSRDLVRAILAERRYRDVERVSLRIVGWARKRALDP